MTRIEHIGDQTLILGDCREVMPTLGRFDACVTDPPYGIGFDYDKHDDMGGADYVKLITRLSDKPRVVLQYPEEMMRYMVPVWGAPDDVFAWCYNSNTNRQFRLFGFWGLLPEWNLLLQPAKNIGDKRVEQSVRSYDWCSDLQQVKNVSAEKTNHPCQVPSKLMKRIIVLTNASTILDPFMGSGTTLVACQQLGRKGTGIELSEKYFDIACKRVEQAAAQPRLFAEPQQKPKQEAML